MKDRSVFFLVFTGVDSVQGQSVKAWLKDS